MATALMPSSSLALELPYFLEDQYVWLSIAAWCVLLTWLWPRVSRRRMVAWIVLACALHLTPVATQMFRATVAITELATTTTFTFWLLQLLNLGVLGIIAYTWYTAHRRSAAQRQEDAVFAERRRIANDLHDGVGSRLQALLASQDPSSVEPHGLSMALQACLLELHMTVDDLDDQSDASIVERLGHLRYRLQPAFDRLGVKLVWDVRDATRARALPSESVVQICRVAQEALSNALRHSGATRVELCFRARGRQRGLMLEVRDDGRGLPVAGCMTFEQMGKGLRSMRARADTLGGDLAVMDVRPHGLSVRLLIPCSEPQRASTQRELPGIL